MKRNKIVKFATWGIVSALVAWGASAIAVYAVSSGRVFDSASMDAVPRQRAAVVMGCVRTLSNGLDNLYFSRRIDAAAVLNKAGTNQPKSKLPIDGIIKIMIKYVPNERKTVCL